MYEPKIIQWTDGVPSEKTLAPIGWRAELQERAVALDEMTAAALEALRDCKACAFLSPCNEQPDGTCRMAKLRKILREVYRDTDAME